MKLKSLVLVGTILLSLAACKSRSFHSEAETERAFKVSQDGKVSYLWLMQDPSTTEMCWYYNELDGAVFSEKINDPKYTESFLKTSEPLLPYATNQKNFQEAFKNQGFWESVRNKWNLGNNSDKLEMAGGVVLAGAGVAGAVVIDGVVVFVAFGLGGIAFPSSAALLAGIGIAGTAGGAAAVHKGYNLVTKKEEIAQKLGIAATDVKVLEEMEEKQSREFMEALIRGYKRAKTVQTKCPPATQLIGKK